MLWWRLPCGCRSETPGAVRCTNTSNPAAPATSLTTHAASVYVREGKRTQIGSSCTSAFWQERRNPTSTGALVLHQHPCNHGLHQQPGDSAGSKHHPHTDPACCLNKWSMSSKSIFPTPHSCSVLSMSTLSTAAFQLMLSLAEPHHINLNVRQHVILAYYSKINLGEINKISKTSCEEFSTVTRQFQGSKWND